MRGPDLAKRVDEVAEHDRARRRARRPHRVALARLSAARRHRPGDRAPARRWSCSTSPSAAWIRCRSSRCATWCAVWAASTRWWCRATSCRRSARPAIASWSIRDGADRRVRHRSRTLDSCSRHARGRHRAPRRRRSTRPRRARSLGCRRRAERGGDRPDRARQRHRQLQRAGFGGRARRAVPGVGRGRGSPSPAGAQRARARERVPRALAAGRRARSAPNASGGGAQPKPEAEQPAAEEQP